MTVPDDIRRYRHFTCATSCGTCARCQDWINAYRVELEAACPTTHCPDCAEPHSGPAPLWDEWRLCRPCAHTAQAIGWPPDTRLGFITARLLRPRSNYALRGTA